MTAAAFYDLDGTLVSTNLVHVFAFYARNDQGILKSLKRSAATIAGLPIFMAADAYSRKVFNDIFFKWYKGQSEDRLRYLAQRLFEEVIGPAVYPGTVPLLEKSRSTGLRQVVVTGALDITIQPLLRHLGITEYVANRLEFVDGRATGRLKPPIMASATKASWIRTYSEKEGLSLSDCFAYADSMSDLPMLSVVGHPTATNPDLRLRSTALRHDWPIVRLKYNSERFEQAKNETRSSTNYERQIMSPVLRRKLDPGTVYIDTDSAPRLIHYGEDFWEEDLPVGTRVIYPKPAIQGLPNPRGAIRHAINHPLGCDPLHAQLSPGMKVTIAVDDISLPLPPMITPDTRQTALEVVLELLEDHGVDDIHIIVANSLHRKMTEPEMRRMVGTAIHDAFYPDRYYCHDAEEPDGIVYLGKTEQSEHVRINRRAVESDLVIYININLVPMDGGHKSVTVGLCDYRSLTHHHDPQTIRDSHGYMDPPASELNHKCVRMGAIVDEHMNVFHIETVLNNRMYHDQLDFLGKNEDDFNELDRMKLRATRWSTGKMPRAAKRAFFHNLPSPYELIACYAGKTDPVHEKTLARCFDQYAIKVKGQCDILIVGVPYISPYNVNSILNPLLVQVMGPGYFFNLFRGKPLLRKGGVLILCHPCYDEFDPKFHPSYIEFFHRLLPETNDAFTLREKYEEEFATNPSYIQMYRQGNAYHGAHPFFMWYWGENGRQHVGKIIAAGAENQHVPEILGWDRAETLAEAIANARSHMGRSAEITMLHLPPIMIPEVE